MVAAGMMLATAGIVWAQGPGEDSLVPLVTHAGAQAEALTEFCATSNRSAIPTYAVALAQWRQRNQWQVVQGFWGQRPELRAAFTQDKAAAAADAKQHGFKTALRCGLLAQVLRSESYDPSLRHARELSELRPPASGGGGAAGGEVNGAAPRAGESGAAAGGTQGRPGFAADTGRAAPEASAARAGASPDSDAAAGPGTMTVGQEMTGGQRLSTGAVRFAVPQGWTVVKSSPDGTILRHGAGRDRPTVLSIAAVPLRGDLRQTLFAAVQAQFPGSGLTFKYFRDAATADGLPVVFGSNTGRLRTGASVSIRAVGIKVGEQVQTAVMLLGGSIGDGIDRGRELEATVAGFEYTGASPGSARWNVLHPRAGSGGLRGLWMGTRMQNQLNPLGGMDLLAIREYALLFPDGRVYFGLPPAGQVDTFDFAAGCARRPKDCGVYRLEGQTIRMEHQGDYGTVTTETVPFHRESATTSNFVEGGATLVEMRPVRDQRLSGNFTATSGMSGAMGGQSTSVFSQTFIQFSPDGRFRKSGFTTTSFSGSGAAGTANAYRGAETGEYHIDGYTLRLEPAGAAPELYTIVFETISETPGAVFLDDRAFLRDGR